MNGDREPAWGLDFYDPQFLADPYPALGRVREATPIFRNEQTGQWMLTRFPDVYEALRDRRLGRVYHHRYTHAELGQPAPDPPLGLLPPTRAVVAAEPRATRPYPHPQAGLQGVHVPFGGRAGTGDRGAVPAADPPLPGNADIRPAGRLRPTLLRGRGRRGAGRAPRRHATVAGLVARHRQDVRAVGVRRSEGAGRDGSGRVHRLHAGADRRQAPLTRRTPDLAARADFRRRRPAQRR